MIAFLARPPAIAAALVMSLAAATAAAHGRFPEAGQVVVDPSDPATIYVRTTYGLLSTRDAGTTWFWSCPEAIGFDADIEDPAVVVASDGTLLVGTFDGLRIGRDEACRFELADDIGSRNVKDVQPEADPSRALALSSNCKADLSCEVRLWETSDDGTTWSEAGVSPPSDFLALSLAPAPSDPTRIYVSGKNQPPLAEEGAIMRSDDRGQSWTRLPVPDSHPGALPYLGGVDPTNADRLYVGRVATDPEDTSKVVGFTLLVSDDGGESFTIAFERQASLPAFALSPDGNRVAIGGPQEGLWIAEADTLQFAKVSELHVRCLTWSDQGIFACTDQFLDGFNLGLSTDDGKTFTPLSETTSPCGPPTWCGADTTIGAECPGRWVQEKAELGAPGCDDTTTTTTGGAGPPPPPADGGCSCRVPRGAESSGWIALAGLGLCLARRRRSPGRVSAGPRGS